MKIGDLARAGDASVESIRFYERAGLLPAADRTPNNYRRFSTRHVQRLVLIRRCRSMGMSLDEIRAIVAFDHQALRSAPSDLPHPESVVGASDCGTINAVLDAHMDHLRQRMVELRGLLNELADLRQRCQSIGEPKDCGILQQLQLAAPHGAGRRGMQPSPSHRRGRGVHAKAKA